VRVLMAGAVTLIIAALLTPPASTQIMLMLALFLLGLGWNFCYVAGSSLLASTLRGEERARVQGINDSLVFFAAGLGSLSAGPLFDLRGMAAVSAVGLSLVLLLVLMIYRLTRAHSLQAQVA
jgi:MFS family permease